MSYNRFNLNKRKFHKRNFSDVIEVLIPDIYIQSDIEVSGDVVDPNLTVINSHIDIASNITNILPLSDPENRVTQDNSNPVTSITLENALGTDPVIINFSRDDNGVAQIDTEGGMEFGYYGLGYVHARDMGDVSLLRYIVYSGRGLQYFDDNFPSNFVGTVNSIIPRAYKFKEDGTVDYDLIISNDPASDVFTANSLSSIALTQHVGNMIEDAETYYNTMPNQYKRCLDLYAEGFNRAIKEHRQRLATSSLVGPTMESLGAFDFEINPVDVILSTHWFTKNVF